MEKCCLVVLMAMLLGVSFCLPAPDRLISELSETTPMKIKTLENSIEQIKFELDKLTRGVAASNADKRSQSMWDLTKSNGLTLRNTQSNGVSFYASLEQDTTLSYGKTLVFQTVKTNNGNDYDKRTGVFTCPTTGTYVFSLVIACESSNYLEVSIVRGENDSLFNNICKNTVPNGVHQNGGNAIVNLNAGDKITVRMVWPSRVDAVVVGSGFSSFSGFLLPS